MGFDIVIPDSVCGGWYWQSRNLTWTFGLMAHSLQCGQVWLFLVRFQPGRRPYRFGFRTMGDATPKLATSKDAGWHFPWQNRGLSGRG